MMSADRKLVLLMAVALLDRLVNGIYYEVLRQWAAGVYIYEFVTDLLIASLT